jgi:hypothetical protein
VTVAVDNATAPIFCSFSAVVAFGVNIAVRNSSVISSTPTFGLSSVVDAVVCRSKSTSRSSPLPS